MDEPVTLQDRYSSALRSCDLRSHPDTTRSDSDVLGAAGIAGKRRPLPIALLRLFSGDSRAAREVVGLLTRMLIGKAWHHIRLDLPEREARGIAQAVLAWHRDGVCRACGGHGYLQVEGAPTISDQQCAHCRGDGKIPFGQHFAGGRRELANWLLAQIEREQALAVFETRRALTPAKIT